MEHNADSDKAAEARDYLASGQGRVVYSFEFLKWAFFLRGLWRIGPIPIRRPPLLPHYCCDLDGGDKEVEKH